ncbi:L-fuculose-phosphate aldolase [Rhodocyclaceae bacterium]|nr:MAG: aldolase [Burkholderiales bacterium]CAG0928567.1 L-fuculose-phosphate aldolase [Rhodocyclaceae bacterium]
MKPETAKREELCQVARSLFERGLSHGATGNLSVRIGDGWLMTPTGASLGALDPAQLAHLDASGRRLGGAPPTKEHALHLAMYRANDGLAAVVHSHSLHAVAVSVLRDVDLQDALPPLTAYYVMRVGHLPVLPYFPPGDPGLAAAVGACAARHHAMLLANHGPVVGGATLGAAVDAMEELEATARLFLLLRGLPTRCLDAAQVAQLRQASQ